ncbi:transcriptional regulator, TetR family [Williamsia sterculiae]|uniref:Transcriptional regulator, TetR family n=2 Tax=Williamsia sterculiae TaxID=1344003 RepID=A0A1N7HF43_9NOCA|nr:transcriptional regulator, TetR family [Williamsia sterculiae]
MTTAGLADESPPPRRRRLTAEAREQQLLDVAETLFAERGLEGVTMEDIARAAGVTRPIVYQHHGSRDGIFLACVSRARTEFEAVLRQRIDTAPDDLAAKIEAGGAPYFELIKRDPRRWSLLYTTSASMEGQVAEALQAMRARTIAQIAAIAREFAPHMPAESLNAFAYAVSGIGEQLGRWWLRNPRVSKTKVLNHYRTFVQAIAVAMLADHQPPKAPQ